MVASKILPFETSTTNDEREPGKVFLEVLTNTPEQNKLRLTVNNYQFDPAVDRKNYSRTIFFWKDDPENQIDDKSRNDRHERTGDKKYSDDCRIPAEPFGDPRADPGKHLMICGAT